MPETVAERHYRDRVQSVKQLAGSLDAERAALSWQDYEDLVALCIELSTSGRDLIGNEYQRIFKNPNLSVGWLKERRQVIEELSDSYLKLVETIRASALQAWRAAGKPNGADLESILDNAIAGVAEAKRSVLERWPIGSPEEMIEAKAAIARGETIGAEEAFAEIAGTDVKTWRKSVEEYQLREQWSPNE